jgi:hypothetical protein
LLEEVIYNEHLKTTAQTTVFSYRCVFCGPAMTADGSLDLIKKTFWF